MSRNTYILRKSLASLELLALLTSMTLGWDESGLRIATPASAEECGDGLTEGAEACDDGNTDDDDYCSADCSAVTGYCGDDNAQSNETCDGDDLAGSDCSLHSYDDGTLACNGDCQGFDTSLCYNYVCGNGILQGDEVCDDGNTADGDYCSSDCSTGTGSCGDNIKQSNETCDGIDLNSHSCSTEGYDGGSLSCAGPCDAFVTTSCFYTCGNGVISGGEGCDDGNTTNSDGCNSSCAVESGWSCGGTPSTCSAICGNGSVHGSEVCDDGNTSDGDYCNSTCSMVTGYCGDGNRQSNETCDGGDLNNETCVTQGYDAGTLSCNGSCNGFVTTSCTYTCGDSNVDPGEQCDDGNVTDNDYCTNTCQNNGSCGDGTRQAGAEACDDGNLSTSDGCSATCTVESGWSCDSSPCTEICGDSITVGSEECDTAGNSGSCDSDCTTVVCGDDHLNTNAGEECDDGNLTDGDGCDSSCVVEECGNALTQSGEDCDDGDDDNTDACTNSCTNAACGDGFVSPYGADGSSGGGDDEMCDDSNLTDGDGCDSSCQSETCGDGAEQGLEECDDGNVTDGDGCDSSCRDEVCGNSVIQSGEDCDDGNADDTDACTNACTDATCGDDILSPLGANGAPGGGDDEECDDGNITDGDDCDSSCIVEECGNAVVQSGEDCDDGNDDETDACISTCVDAVCGDHFLQTGVDECDDGNLVDGDGCSATCEDESPDAPECGNGIVDGDDECDDGNTESDDGCSRLCAIEEVDDCGDRGCDRLMTYGDNEYLFYHSDSIISWDDAESVCQGVGGHLVSITSDGEATAVNTLVGDSQDLWLGLNDQATEGVYVWSSGEEFDYDHWHAGQPNGGGENCGLFAHSGWPDDPLDWGDYTCDGGDIPYNYICEISNVCGDGAVVDAEECDDGNEVSGDGCSATCTEETGYSCSGEPSTCITTCGDGVLAGSELCDDGNLTGSDGCSATCTVTSGYVCVGSAPSVCSFTATDSGNSGGGGMRGSGTNRSTGPVGRARQIPGVQSQRIEVDGDVPAAEQRRRERLDAKREEEDAVNVILTRVSKRKDLRTDRMHAAASAEAEAMNRRAAQRRQERMNVSRPEDMPSPSRQKGKIR